MIFYSIHFNRPDFIELQLRYIQRTGDRLVVVNNHGSPDIQKVCSELGVTCHTYEPPDNVVGSWSHGYALNYLRSLIDQSEDYCLIDHDLFPYNKINLDIYDIIGVKSSNIPNKPYLWPGFLACRKGVQIDHINFLPGIIPGGDTGCDTSKLIESNRYNIHFCLESYLGIENSKYRGQQVTRYNAILQTEPVIVKYDNLCLHYLNGSEWMQCDSNTADEKRELLINSLNMFSGSSI